MNEIKLRYKGLVIEVTKPLALPSVKREPRDLTNLQIVFWTGFLALLTVGGGYAVIQYLILPLLRGGKP